jgi:UDP-hydrolysing UDP-N-acetyl-D-glucosamine 2-epimerase
MVLRKINKIFYFSVSRSDYYITYNLLSYLASKKNLKINTVITGMHYAKIFGNTKDNLIHNKKISQHKIPVDYKNCNFMDKDILSISTKFINSISFFLKKKKPKIIMLLGDRYETFLIAYCATIYKIPIIHIHGGELTLGSYDDNFRHSITKMSHWHLSATQKSKKRIIQLGENKKNVFNIGSLSLDNIKKTSILNYKILSNKFNIDEDKELVLMTYHPTTLNAKKDNSNIHNIINFLKKENFFVIITAPGADTGSSKLKKLILHKIKKLKNFKFINNLGFQNYISLLKCSKFLIGNSSSGIIEAPLLNKISINVGDRQKLREISPTILNIDGSVKSLKGILKKISKKEKINFKINSTLFPYYKKDPIKTAGNIISKIKIPENCIKKFYTKN